MEEETSEEYEARVQRETEAADAIQNRRIKRKTETEYSRTYHPKTVQWFKKEYPELVVDGQIKYDELEWSQFKRYLGTRKVKKRKKFRSDTHDNFQLAGESTMQKYVAAERFYAGKQMPSFSFSSSFEKNLTEFMTGHRKMIKEQQATGKRMEEDKEYLPWTIYRWLMQYFLTYTFGGHVPILCMAFLSITWNLMCRGINTETIKLSQLKADGDCIIFDFKVTKKNQEGKKEEKKHVFCNSDDPSICCFTSLGLWLLLYAQPYTDEALLFPGGNQRLVYHDHENKALKSDAGAKELQYYSMTWEDIGLHSIRKGVSTFVTMGSTICNIVAVCLRAGWMMGVQGRYFKHEGAGDCFVGRACCGSPINSIKFVKLPPRFIRNEDNDRLVASSIASAFPTLAVNDTMNGVLSLVLASLAYHYETIIEDLPQNSRIRSTYPFITPNFLKDLHKIVVCCYEWDECNFDKLQAKGASPEHYAMKERAEMRKDIKKDFAEVTTVLNSHTKELVEIKKAVEDLPKKTSDVLEEFCEKNAISNGVVTQQQFLAFTSEITTAFNRATKDIIAAAQNIPLVQDEVDEVDEVDADVAIFETAAVKPVKPWGGKLRRLRKGFVYPNVGLKEALTVWFFGGYYEESCLTEEELCRGERVRYPPLRLIACHDLERHNHVCKSKWSKVLNAVTQFTPNIPEYPSVLQMVEIMENGKHAVMAPHLSYHVDQSSNSITTMYDYLHKNGWETMGGKRKPRRRNPSRKVRNKSNKS